mgnify:CR=1 FL=1
MSHAFISSPVRFRFALRLAFVVFCVESVDMLCVFACRMPLFLPIWLAAITVYQFRGEYRVARINGSKHRPVHHFAYLTLDNRRMLILDMILCHLTSPPFVTILCPI